MFDQAEADRQLALKLQNSESASPQARHVQNRLSGLLSNKHSHTFHIIGLDCIHILVHPIVDTTLPTPHRNHVVAPNTAGHGGGSDARRRVVSRGGAILVCTRTLPGIRVMRP